MSSTIEITRTSDVVSDATTFHELLVSRDLCDALAACGVTRPSPVQQVALPLALTGADLIVQAKSGTGKTVVFGVVCVHTCGLGGTGQAAVVAPTREIAVQIQSVINSLARGVSASSGKPSLNCGSFIGGLPVSEDSKRLRRSCEVVVGTPGRLCELVNARHLSLAGIKVFVLDEADRLLGDMYDDVAFLYEHLPKRKQVLACSATLTDRDVELLLPMMKKPQRINLCEDTVTLAGVRQVYSCLGDGVQGAAKPDAASAFEAKAQAMLRLLRGVSFNQAVVFCNEQRCARWLTDWLLAWGFPTAFMTGRASQPQRLQILSQMRDFSLRVVVSTDVLARGIDLEYVNLVVNLDLPYDCATYMHRVGRTGRFGTYGIAVTFVDAPDLVTLQQWVADAGGAITELPEVIPPEWYKRDVSAAFEAATASSQRDGGGPPPLLPHLTDYLPDAHEDGAACAGANQGPDHCVLRDARVQAVDQSGELPVDSAIWRSSGAPTPVFEAAHAHDASVEAQCDAWDRTNVAVVDYYVAAVAADTQLLQRGGGCGGSQGREEGVAGGGVTSSSGRPREEGHARHRPLQQQPPFSADAAEADHTCGLASFTRASSNAAALHTLLDHVLCPGGMQSRIGGLQSIAPAGVDNRVRGLLAASETCPEEDLQLVEFALLRKRMNSAWLSWQTKSAEYERLLRKM